MIGHNLGKSYILLDKTYCSEARQYCSEGKAKAVK
jgi:hypothetical protein